MLTDETWDRMEKRLGTRGTVQCAMTRCVTPVGLEPLMAMWSSPSLIWLHTM